jgi:hypothetical protein
MKRNAFVPTVETRLEERMVLSTTAAATALPPPTFGGGQIDWTIPYVLGSNVPNQNNLNFSSFTFHSVVSSIHKDFATFNRTGNIGGLENGLAAVVRRIPFGPTQFSATVASDISGLSSANRDTGGTAEAQVLNDLLVYLDEGIGQKFNVVKSHQSFKTDVFLTYNDKI